MTLYCTSITGSKIVHLLNICKVSTIINVVVVVAKCYVSNMLGAKGILHTPDTPGRGVGTGGA
jgi:hypothetical protein